MREKFEKGEMNEEDLKAMGIIADAEYGEEDGEIEMEEGEAEVEEKEDDSVQTESVC